MLQILDDENSYFSLDIDKLLLSITKQRHIHTCLLQIREISSKRTLVKAVSWGVHICTNDFVDVCSLERLELLIVFLLSEWWLRNCVFLSKT